MIVNCQEHRKSMELLGLKLKLKQGVADPEEKNAVKERISVLQKELKLD